MDDDYDPYEWAYENIEAPKTEAPKVETLNPNYHKGSGRVEVRRTDFDEMSKTRIISVLKQHLVEIASWTEEVLKDKGTSSFLLKEVTGELKRKLDRLDVRVKDEVGEISVEMQRAENGVNPWVNGTFAGRGRFAVIDMTSDQGIKFGVKILWRHLKDI